IAADCAIGTKRFRIRTKTGLSDMQTFRVGPLPNVAEVEPNNEFITPQALAMNSTVEGRITNEDVDYFVVEAKKGERITAEIEAIRLGDSFFDAYVAILNAERFELSTSDDAALVYQDGIATLIAPEDGKYIIQIRETSWGNGNYYRCHVGHFPRPRAVVPAGGKPGEKLTLKFTGDIGGDITQEVQLPVEPQWDYAVIAQDDRGLSPSGVPFRLSPLDNALEAEPNDAVAQATVGPAPGAFNGQIGQQGDVDFFKFTATKGQVLDIHVYARRLRSELDPVLTVHNAQGGNLAGNDDTGGPDSYLRFTAPADGEFLLSVRDHLARGGNAFHYRVEVTPVTPKLELTVNEFVQYREPKIVVPQGNRFPVLINTTRRDFGGPIEFLGENLPAGVTIESIALVPDQSVAQVLLVAAADAPIGGTLGQIVGKLADPNQPLALISGLTRQDCIMSRGQNQRPVFVETMPSLAIGVIEKAPFTVQIVQPKVPLVQNGVMQLKVVATRAEGFTAPIKIDLLNNPPGLNSSRESSIAEGQTEATITLNTAGNAQVKDHPIAVRGEATVGNGAIMVCSPFTTLKVTEPYVTLAFQQSAIELGAEGAMVVTVETPKAYEGEAQVTLLGLPNKVTAEPMKLTKNLKELIFKLKAEADAPPGMNKNVFCQITITQDGEPIQHNLGSGVLRVDKPLPPKPNAAPVAAAPAEKKPEAAPAKPLSRLEQLRLEQKQKLESQGAPAVDAKPAGGQ
ncbi:MAG TPA: PPC domain-containing protein, partial [Planctomycetaceae bacterium]|nr:PPC domain-containing protein [Planctomycetaceae bacterium]